MLLDDSAAAVLKEHAGPAHALFRFLKTAADLSSRNVEK
jgi:hypothetical protein